MSEKEQKKKNKDLVEEKEKSGGKKEMEDRMPDQQEGGQQAFQNSQAPQGYAPQAQQNSQMPQGYGQQSPQNPQAPQGYGQQGSQNSQEQGYYGYQNPYHNNWQNQRYYGNDRNRRGWNDYNNYPNQNYGYTSQQSPYSNQGSYQAGNYGPSGNNGFDTGEKKKSGRGKKVLLTVCISALLVLCVGGIYFAVNIYGDTSGEVQQTVAQPENAEPQISEVDLSEPAETSGDAAKPSQGNLTDVSDLAERIMPSVVSVNAVYTYSSYFWGDEKYDGGGSGFIIGENETELLIATNAHVIADSEDLKVTFVDETEADAMVKGYDNDLDVAVIAIKLDNISEETKGNIAVAKLGDSTTLRAGQAVISIGNALLLGQSVTTGIVSATNVPVGGGYDEMGNQYGSDDRVMIQTTAFMNPGCSGGVLINASGEVVGINTMTISSVDVEGMCYAIPISDAIPVLDNLKKREIRERLRESESGYLGISCSNVEQKQAREYDIPNGVYVREVNEDGPADKAGIRKGDVIVALNEVPVGTMDELSDMLRYYPVGEIVQVEIMRYEQGEYQSKIMDVKLGRK